MRAPPPCHRRRPRRRGIATVGARFHHGVIGLIGELAEHIRTHPGSIRSRSPEASSRIIAPRGASRRCKKAASWSCARACSRPMTVGWHSARCLFLPPGGENGARSMCLAVPGRIVSLEIATALGWPMSILAGSTRGLPEYVPDAGVDDYVIVHVGFAIQRLDEQSAIETLRSFDSSASWTRSSGTASNGPRQSSGLAADPQKGGRNEVPRRIQ